MIKKNLSKISKCRLCMSRGQSVLGVGRLPYSLFSWNIPKHVLTKFYNWLPSSYSKRKAKKLKNFRDSIYQISIVEGDGPNGFSVVKSLDPPDSWGIRRNSLLKLGCMSLVSVWTASIDHAGLVRGDRGQWILITRIRVCPWLRRRTMILSKTESLVSAKRKLPSGWRFETKSNPRRLLPSAFVCALAPRHSPGCDMEN